MLKVFRTAAVAVLAAAVLIHRRPADSAARGEGAGGPVKRAFLGGLLAVAAVAVIVVPADASATSSSGGVDFHHRLQSIDGFGFSQAFQRADVMHGARGLTPAGPAKVRGGRLSVQLTARSLTTVVLE